MDLFCALFVLEVLPALAVPEWDHNAAVELWRALLCG